MPVLAGHSRQCIAAYFEAADPIEFGLQGDDVELVNRLRNLLDLVVILVLLTGLQAFLADIIEVRNLMHLELIIASCCRMLPSDTCKTRLLRLA